MLNDYHKKRSEAAIKAVEEMSKRPFSLEQVREQTERLLRASDEEVKYTSEEEQRKIFEASPRRKELLLSWDEQDKQTIVEALEITIINRLTSNGLSGAPDFGVKRFINWRHLAMNLDVQITMTPRHPIINLIRQNLIQPLKQQIQESNFDSDSMKVVNEKIQYYTNLIRKLNFEQEK